MNDDELYQHFFNALTKSGIDENRARQCAQICVNDANRIDRTEEDQELISEVYNDLDWSLVA